MIDRLDRIDRIYKVILGSAYVRLRIDRLYRIDRLDRIYRIYRMDRIFFMKTSAITYPPNSTNTHTHNCTHYLHPCPISNIVSELK